MKRSILQVNLDNLEKLNFLVKDIYQD